MLRMRLKCSVEGCESFVHSKGMCSKHYYHQRRYGSPFPKDYPTACSMPECSLPYHGKGLCKKHYLAQWNVENHDAVRKYRKGPRAKVWAAKKNIRARLAALAAYGGKCACCGESDVIYLQLDHIQNDGRADRALHGLGGRFYSSLKRRGYPLGLQVLCANCHNAKTHYDGCGDRHSRKIP